MVIITNKSNRPIGIAGQSVLPDKEIKIRDKDAYCDVFDEYGNATGEKILVPGLTALINRGFVSVKEEKEEKQAKKAKPVEEEPEEKPVKKTRAKKSAPKEETAE